MVEATSSNLDRISSVRVNQNPEIGAKFEHKKYLDTQASYRSEEDSETENVPKQKESGSSSVVNVAKWLWESFCGIFSSKKAEEIQGDSNGVDGVKGVGGKPRLEEPTIQLNKNNLNKLLKEMGDLLNKIKGSTEETENNLLDDQQKGDLTMHLLIMCVKRQQNLKEEEVGLGKEVVQMHHEDMVRIREEYFNVQKEIVERAKTSKVLGWVATGLTAGALCAATAGLAISAVASFGATAPAAAIMMAKTVFFLLGSGLSIASGSLGISKAVLMKKDGEQKAVSTLLQNERKVHGTGSKDYMDVISKDFERFLQLVSMLRQIADNDQKAKRAQNV